MKKSIPNAEDRNKILGRQLQKCRKEARITQEEMANFCNISKNHLSKIENGVCTCTAHLLIDYGKKLNISLDTFAEREPSKDETHIQNLLPELQAKLENMSQSNQEKLLNILNILEK